MENTINILEKNFEEQGCDRISELPDSLLLHILSFLHMEDVLMTSFLSRRWRYIWTSITRMDFNFGPSQERILRPIEYITTFIDKSISLHTGSKELDLDFGGEGSSIWEVEDYDVERKLTRHLFNCRSLRTLSLTYVALHPPASTSFSSLKTLYLAGCLLSANKIKNLTSNSPLLEDIVIKNCSSAQNLNIFVENQQLHSLTVIDSVDEHFYNDHDNHDFFSVFGYGPDDMCYMTTKIEIYAPNLLSLKLIGNKPRREYHIKNLQSLVEAWLDYEQELHDGCHLCYEHNINALKGLLEDLRHVKVLVLCSWCIQLLSSRELQGLNALSINSTCLELMTGLSKWELPGIAHLLRSCCSLETLIIHFDKKPLLEVHNYDSQERVNWEDNYNFVGRVYWKSQKPCFFKLFGHLKTVVVYDLFICNPTPYKPTPINDEIESVMDEPEKETRFLKFLLSNSTVMERMDINILKEVCDQPESLLDLTERLLAFPRASPKAEIHVSY